MPESSALTVILVRHGNTFEEGVVSTQIGARSDLALTEKGREQARLMGEYLARQKYLPCALYAGALQRQTEAVRIIARCLGADNAVKTGEPALTEIDYGLWEGLSTGEIRAGFQAAYDAWTKEGVWPERIFLETRAERREKITAWLKRLWAEHGAGRDVLAVSSNGVIREFCTLIPEVWSPCVQSRGVDALKVNTGNYCELALCGSSLSLLCWNKNPA